MKLITFAALTALSSSVHALSVPFMEQTALLFGWQDGGAPSAFTVDDDEKRDRRHRRPSDMKEGGTILDKLRDDKRFSKFVEILEQHRGLRDDLERTDAKVTVFAPTNEAIRKFKESMGEEHGRDRRGHGGHDDRNIDMDQVVRYHMIHDKFSRDELFDGMTLQTELKLRELDNNRQRIRVFKMKGNIILNMYARVDEEMEAENGYVMAVDNVLVPPPDILETLWYLPTKFSTFISAIQKVDLEEELEKHKAMTVFVPANAAWESLGLRNLVYLFSKRGEQDLKKVLEFHMSTQLAYADEIIENKKMELATRLKGEKLELNIKKRHEKGGEGNDFESEHRRGEGKEQCPREYIISLNDGEATVVFTDAVAENGNIHLINSVLIPDSVKLPYEKSF